VPTFRSRWLPDGVSKLHREACTFRAVDVMGFQPEADGPFAARGHICNLCIYQLLLFFHMRTANQPAITGVTLCHKSLKTHGLHGVIPKH